MSNTMNKSALALSLSAGLLVGCGDKASEHSGIQKVGDEVCTRSLNLLSNDPNNPNSQVFHAKGLIFPVIIDCSTTTGWSAATSARINFTRSASLQKPTSGTVVSSTVNIGKQEIADFAKTINRPTQIWKNVKPYYAPETKPTITIKQWTIQGNASPEWKVEWGDRSLIENNPVGNTQIAAERANAVKNELIKALESTGATVTGQAAIKITTQVNPLNPEELGRLYAEWLLAKDNWANVVMDRIRDYNTAWLTSPALDKIIWDKRYSSAHIEYTAMGIDRTVDTSNWNYAYWLWLLATLWYTGRGIATRNKRKR